MPRYVTIEERGDIALVRIDRPPANALDPELLEDGHAVLGELAAAEPAAVVITGRDGFFSAGADLKVAPTLDAEGQRTMVTGINRLFAGWYGFERPVVCAVNGHAIAGGLILALCGDYRVGSTEGRLGLTEIRAGLPYPANAIAVVRAELSPQSARVLALRAELIDPAEALARGAVDELVAPDEVLPRALEVAAGLAELPSTAYGQVKRQLRGDALERMREVVEEGAEPLLEAWVSDETEGAASGILARERRV
jgi:enoyl-CoA hydratase